MLRAALRISRSNARSWYLAYFLWNLVLVFGCTRETCPPRARPFGNSFWHWGQTAAVDSGEAGYVMMAYGNSVPIDVWSLVPCSILLTHLVSIDYSLTGSIITGVSILL